MTDPIPTHGAKPVKRSFLKVLLLPFSITLSAIAGGVVGAIGGVLTGAVAGGALGYTQGSVSSREATKFHQAIADFSNQVQENKQNIATEFGNNIKINPIKGSIYSFFSAIAGAAVGMIAGTIGGTLVSSYVTAQNTHVGQSYFSTLAKIIRTTFDKKSKTQDGLQASEQKPLEKILNNKIMKNWVLKPIYLILAIALQKLKEQSVTGDTTNPYKSYYSIDGLNDFLKVPHSSVSAQETQPRQNPFSYGYENGGSDLPFSLPTPPGPSVQNPLTTRTQDLSTSSTVSISEVGTLATPKTPTNRDNNGANHAI